MIGKDNSADALQYFFFLFPVAVAESDACPSHDQETMLFFHGG